MNHLQSAVIEDGVRTKLTKDKNPKSPKTASHMHSKMKKKENFVFNTTTRQGSLDESCKHWCRESHTSNERSTISHSHCQRQLHHTAKPQQTHLHMAKIWDHLTKTTYSHPAHDCCIYSELRENLNNSKKTFPLMTNQYEM